MSTMSIYLHLLLVVLHLPEACLLQKPQNLKVTSLNMGAVLSWDAPRRHPSGVSYTAEIRSLEDFEPACRSVGEQWCDFGVLPNCHGLYELRVRAELENETSLWSQTDFEPAEQTVIGPPNVTLVRKAEGLELTFTDPAMKTNSSLRDCVREVTYTVKYWKKNHQDDVGVKQGVTTQKVTLRHLDSDTSYCVQASVYVPNSPLKGQDSDPQCASESAVKKFSATAVVSLVVVAVALPLILVTAWLVHRGSRFFNPRVSLPPYFQKHLLEGPCVSAMLPLHASSSMQEQWDRISCLYEERPHDDATSQGERLLQRVENGGRSGGEEMVQYNNILAAGVAYQNIMAFETSE